MDYRNLLVEDVGAIRRITLNRPDKLNALDHATIGELHAAFEAARKDPAVRVVVLTRPSATSALSGCLVATLAAASRSLDSISVSARSVSVSSRRF